MDKILDLISQRVADGFARAGYDAGFGKVTVSNRPDLCEYQCNGAMPAAKTYHKAPIQIAEDVAAAVAGDEAFSEVQAVKPGFLNLRLNPEWLAAYLEQMRTAERFGVAKDPAAGTVVVTCARPLSARASSASSTSSATKPSATPIWATGDCRWAL